jgi:hypothetical protein
MVLGLFLPWHYWGLNLGLLAWNVTSAESPPLGWARSDQAGNILRVSVPPPIPTNLSLLGHHLSSCSHYRYLDISTAPAEAPS